MVLVSPSRRPLHQKKLYRRGKYLDSVHLFFFINASICYPSFNLSLWNTCADVYSIYAALAPTVAVNILSILSLHLYTQGIWNINCTGPSDIIRRTITKVSSIWLMIQKDYRLAQLIYLLNILLTLVKVINNVPKLLCLCRLHQSHVVNCSAICKHCRCKKRRNM